MISFIIKYLEDDEFVSVGVGKLLQLWGDHFAWTAPRCMKVDQDEEIPRRFQLSFEISLQIEMLVSYLMRE